MHPRLVSLSLQAPCSFHDAAAIGITKTLALPWCHADRTGSGRTGLDIHQPSLRAGQQSAVFPSAIPCGFQTTRLSWGSHTHQASASVMNWVVLAGLLGRPFLLRKRAVRVPLVGPVVHHTGQNPHLSARVRGHQLPRNARTTRTTQGVLASANAASAAAARRSASSALRSDASFPASARSARPWASRRSA
jgi:hypothetical protein